MDILSIPYREFKAFFLVLIRVSIIFQMFPFFNAKVIPVLAKAGLAFVITIILFPMINTRMVEFPHNNWNGPVDINRIYHRHNPGTIGFGIF